jgi:pimeloyl-ACP methyl ester carboxylesterase
MGAHHDAMKPDADLTPPGLAQLIVDLIAALDLTAPTVVSNDTCTAITQLVLTLHPGVVGRAVMTTGDAFRYFFPPAFRGLQALGYMPPMLKYLAKSVGSPAIRRSPLAFGLLTRVGISDDVARSWAASLIRDKGVRRDAAKVLRGINTRYTMAAAKALPTLDVPVLLVWGEDDRGFPMKLATRLEALIPDCKLVTAPNSRAYVSLDAPEILVGAITSFVPVGGDKVGP